MKFTNKRIRIDNEDRDDLFALGGTGAFITFLVVMALVVIINKVIPYLTSIFK